MSTTGRRCTLWLCLIALALTGQAVEAPSAPPPPDGREQVSPADLAPAPSSGGAGAATFPAPQPLTTTQPFGSTRLPSGGTVAIIRIEGLIYDFTLESLRRRVDRAQSEGAAVLVIELDTPGGLVESALKIAKYIKTLNLPTIAWINNEAYSAGIMIAAACDAIVMSPASATGDCAPIVPGQNLSPTERAKALSPILEEFRDSAHQNGYEFALFHAMCVLGVEVYQVHNPATGEHRLVNQVDFNIMVHGALPQTAPGGAAGPTTMPAGYEPTGEASQSIATDADRGQWVLVRRVHDGRTLLTVNQQRALDTGLAKAIVRDEQDLEQLLAAPRMVRIAQSWSENLAGWLTSPWVRAVLVLALLLGAYMEFQSPGVGLPGLVALIALVLLLGAPFLVGLAEVWHLILFFLGFILLMMEIFITPGFGVLGIAGIACMFIGLVLSVVPTSGSGPMPMPAPETWYRLQQSIISLLAGGILSGVGFFYLTRHFGSIPVLNRLVLRTPALLPAGVAPPPAPVAGDEVIAHGQLRVGEVGRAVSILRPIGRAEFAGRVIDVQSLGAWIEPGKPVRVIEVHGNRIVVDVAQ